MRNRQIVLVFPFFSYSATIWYNISNDERGADKIIWGISLLQIATILRNSDGRCDRYDMRRIYIGKR